MLLVEWQFLHEPFLLRPIQMGELQEEVQSVLGNVDTGLDYIISIFFWIFIVFNILFCVLWKEKKIIL